MICDPCLTPIRALEKAIMACPIVSISTAQHTPAALLPSTRASWCSYAIPRQRAQAVTRRPAVRG